MSTFASNGCNLASNIAEKHLPLLNALDFDLLLLSWLEVKTGDALELEFRHSS